MKKKPVDKQAKILKQLVLLNEHFIKQKNIKHVFMLGIVHGIGFFVGSAIVATILFGIFGPYFAEIDWISETYTRGNELK